MFSEEMSQQIKMLKEIYIPYPDFATMDWTETRNMMIEAARMCPVSEGIEFCKDTIQAVPVEWGLHKDSMEDPFADGKKLIFHVHGGGFSVGDPECGRYALSRLAVQTGWNTISIGYRMAPEYQYPAPIEDCMKVYNYLLEHGYKAENISFIGESAGGAIVLSLVSYCKTHNIPMPGSVCAVSPSVDFTFQSKSLKTNANREIIVNCNVADQVRQLFLGDQDPTDPVASPIFADLTGWPPVYLYVSTEEILFDESIRMYLKLEDAEVPVKLSVAEGLFHCYMFNPSPEAEEALDMIGEFFMEPVNK